MQNFTVFILLLTLTIIANPIWADSYPEMKDTVKCSQKTELETNESIKVLRDKMQQQLKTYNNSRFKMADVLRAMVDDYSLQGYSKKRILSYAEHYEDMSRNIPNLDPDTADYKNFDFRLGMSFASTTIFLNTTDDVVEHFLADQKDPESKLSKYVAEIDKEGDIYTNVLDKYRKEYAASCT